MRYTTPLQDLQAEVDLAVEELGLADAELQRAQDKVVAALRRVDSLLVRVKAERERLGVAS